MLLSQTRLERSYAIPKEAKAKGFWEQPIDSCLEGNKEETTGTSALRQVLRVKRHPGGSTALRAGAWECQVGPSLMSPCTPRRTCGLGSGRSCPLGRRCSPLGWRRTGTRRRPGGPGSARSLEARREDEQQSGGVNLVKNPQ